MSRVRLNLLLLLVAAALIAWPLLQAPASSDFVGTDNQAIAAVGELDPDYRPWAESPLQPEAGTETLLFAAQAAVGLAFIGYYFVGRRTRGCQNSDDHAA